MRVSEAVAVAGSEGVKVGSGVNVRVCVNVPGGVKVRVGVNVRLGVEAPVSVGGRVGACDFPGPQAEKDRLA